MHSFRLSFLTCLILSGAGVLVVPAHGQQRGNDAPPPPKLEPLEEGEAPAVTIRKPGGDNKTAITQKREKGKVTQVRVQSGGSTYYLKPNDQPGAALPGDGQSARMRAPQWEVLEFDLKRAKDATPPDANQSEAPAAPAAAGAKPASKR